MRAHLARDMEVLQTEILEMGSLVEDAVNMAIRAYVERDAEMAEAIAAGDDQIDMKELEVEEQCLKTLALHQPVAGDLRFLVVMLKVNNDLERMGDLAIHIAKRAVRLSKDESIGLPSRFNEMADLVRQMVRMSLECLISRDSEQAMRVIITDDLVDDIHEGIYKELRDRMRSEEGIIDRAFYTISICRHLERIGDLATNIAEDVYFMVEGEIIRHQVEDGSREDN